MTFEQTKEQFLLAYNSNAYLNMCESDDMHNVIVALEKQIPKKPDLDDGVYCPCCLHEFKVHYDTTRYCPNCGQAIDWGDSK
jgi:hypothetical protein